MSVEEKLAAMPVLPTIAELGFVIDMRAAREAGVGFGWMQCVIEWEWQSKGPGAWGPEYFRARMKELQDKIKNLQQRCEHEWAESLNGPDVVGKHCIHCDVDYDYDDGGEG